MSERKVLFIVEGRRDEPRLLKKMHSMLFGTQLENIYSYETTVYDLLKKMFDHDEMDCNLDVISVLRETELEPERRIVLEREYSDIYLIFDMDPQESRYEECSHLLESAMLFFSDSTVNGKLYLNYPMLESYKHLRAHDDISYFDRVVGIDEIREYKSVVESECHPHFKHLNRYTEDTMREIIFMNVRKANKMLSGVSNLPGVDDYRSWEGIELLRIQRESFADDGVLFVLNTSVFYPIDFNPTMFLPQDAIDLDFGGVGAS